MRASLTEWPQPLGLSGPDAAIELFVTGLPSEGGRVLYGGSGDSAWGANHGSTVPEIWSRRGAEPS